VVRERNEIPAPAEHDAATEAAVLVQVLALHPTQPSFDELLREVASDPDDFSQRDAIERAVRDLAASGLLHRSGELVLPTRAALRFDELLAG